MLSNLHRKNNSVTTNVIGFTKTIALFTNARDEGHIKEWVAHHLLIGFDYIFIFDHKSLLPLTTVFRNFDKRVKIINVSHMNGAIKTELMNVAANISKSLKIDWLLYLDADEFLILNHKKFKGVKHFLDHYQFADSLGVNWLMFGSNYLKKEPKGLIFDNYTRSAKNLDMHVKSFTRPSQIINSSNPHYYNIINKNRMYGVDKKLTHIPAFNKIAFSFDVVPAYIAHYFHQSEETYKKRKGLIPRDDNGTYREITDNDIKNIHDQFNEIENLDPMNKYSEKIKQFLSKFNDGV